MSTKRTSCLIESCSATQDAYGFIRGLCQSHYLSLGKMVKAERTTWRQLEGFGIALPSRKMKKSLAEDHFQKCMKRLRKEE